MADLTHLRLERPSEGVVLLTLDNPDMRNAMSDEMTSSWVAAIDELAQDTTVRVVVVTGAGSAFCSGGNTGWIASEPDATVDALRARMMPFYRAWLSIRRLEVPTIAAVNGHAIGAGLCLALACDIRYAAAGARLGVPFNKLGMHAGMAGTWLLPDVVGPAHARDLLLTGRVVEADEALRLGLVSRVIEPDGFLDDVLGTAAGIASTAPIASRLTKIALADGGHADFESALQWEALAQPMTLATHDLPGGHRRGPREARACLPGAVNTVGRATFSGGPVAALRRIAFLMERQREETRRIEAFRNAARTILPLPEDEVLARAENGTLTELAGIGPSTAAVITDACRGVVPERLAALERTAGPLVPGGRELRARLRGDLHSHSDWSDGGSPLEEMAMTAVELGHDYLVLTDHSPRLKVARGLSAERLTRQLGVIEAVNAHLGDSFTLLKGIEVDILDDGSLDQTDEMLGSSTCVWRASTPSSRWMRRR